MRKLGASCLSLRLGVIFLGLGGFFAGSTAWASPSSARQEGSPSTVALDEKYALKEAPDWAVLLGSQISSVALPLLNAARYQEAIWLLEESDRPEQAAAIKQFLTDLLAHGEIASDGLVPLGMGGATRPQAVYFPQGVKAVFKRRCSHPSSNYKSEIAAYLFDQMLDFRLVPVTVKRKLGKHKGSMQFFIKDGVLAGKIPDYKKSANLNVFDYLISNKDRNGGNIILLQGREVAIDHGLALRGANFFGRTLNAFDHVIVSFGYVKDKIRQIHLHPDSDIAEYRADRRILSKLADLTLHELRTQLAPYLSSQRAERIYRKKESLLAKLHAANYW